ncbi:hypothetical protein Bca52824_073646 [Brassica carinata]|uniref:Uncharacterized protein n=1 Tax=Brassica carinata TaxID=52824 RepID=A0A8X7U5E8_BRACI|nr:hypothetical protein Bca52824_073646 [Brassica carinata]
MQSFEGDGLHIRRACHGLIEEEVDVMKSKFEEVSLHRSLQFEVEEMRDLGNDVSRWFTRGDLGRAWGSVFSTIGDIMQAALDVEEGDESDESGNRSKEIRRRMRRGRRSDQADDNDAATVAGLFRRGGGGAMRNPIVRLILKTIRSTLRNITGGESSQSRIK